MSQDVEVSDTFAHTCPVCGGERTVEAGVAQPHRCRVDVDAQKATWRGRPVDDATVERLAAQAADGYVLDEDGAARPPLTLLAEERYAEQHSKPAASEDDWLTGAQACQLRPDGTVGEDCEACQ